MTAVFSLCLNSQKGDVERCCNFPQFAAKYFTRHTNLFSSKGSKGKIAHFVSNHPAINIRRLLSVREKAFDRFYNLPIALLSIINRILLVLTANG